MTIEGVGSRASLLDLGLALAADGELDDSVGELEWPEIQKRCRILPLPPVIADTYTEILATKQFTQPDDLDMLLEKYIDTFNGVMAATQLLVFCDLNWGD